MKRLEADDECCLVLPETFTTWLRWCAYVYEDEIPHDVYQALNKAAAVLDENGIQPSFDQLTNNAL